MRPGAEDIIQQLKDAIIDQFPNSRERSLALTKLQECELWLGAIVTSETAPPTKPTGA